MIATMFIPAGIIGAHLFQFIRMNTYQRIVSMIHFAVIFAPINSLDEPLKFTYIANDTPNQVNSIQSIHNKTISTSSTKSHLKSCSSLPDTETSDTVPHKGLTRTVNLSTLLIRTAITLTQLTLSTLKLSSFQRLLMVG